MMHFKKAVTLEYNVGYLTQVAYFGSSLPGIIEAALLVIREGRSTSCWKIIPTNMADTVSFVL
jgi:hypothetical protein